MGTRPTPGGYLVGRLAVLTGLMPVAGFLMLRHGGLGHPSFQGFFLLTGAAFTFTLATALAVRKKSAGELLLLAQPAWDIFYTTSLVYLSGGWLSPFLFLYLMAIIGGATLYYRSGAIAVATVSALVYAGFSALQAYGVISPLNPFPIDEAVEGNLALKVGFQILAFYAVALLSGFLAEELRRAGERLEIAKAEILDLEHLQTFILQSMGSGLIATNTSGEVMFFNQYAAALFARAGVDTAKPQQLFDMMPGDRHEVSIKAGKGMVLGYSVFPLTGRDGARIGKILTFQDLTGIRKLEEGMKRADRMAAVGRLAAGLAHEIRNPLASLSGSAQVLKAGLAAQNPEQELLLGIVLRETERLNRLVTDFLGYARPGALRLSTFDLSEFVGEIGFFFMQGEGRSGFELVNGVPAGLMLEADREQMESLLLNLLRNSREAAPDGVRVEVGATAAGGVLELEIADNGPGIDAEIAARAFEPFVSSKEGGTGLGLATVHRIAQEHGGSAVYENRPGGGAVFRVRLPLRQA